jgi:hypothetical protein
MIIKIIKIRLMVIKIRLIDKIECKNNNNNSTRNKT